MAFAVHVLANCEAEFLQLLLNTADKDLSHHCAASTDPTRRGLTGTAEFLFRTVESFGAAAFKDAGLSFHLWLAFDRQELPKANYGFVR